MYTVLYSMHDVFLIIIQHAGLIFDFFSYENLTCRVTVIIQTIARLAAYSKVYSIAEKLVWLTNITSILIEQFF